MSQPNLRGRLLIVGSRRRVAVAAIALLLSAAAASGQEIRVMTSGGFTAPLLEVLPEFERATNQKVVTVFGASIGGAPDSIPVRLARREAADLVIVSAEALDALVEQGTVARGTRVDLVRSRIGVAVRAGTPKPDISSVDALKRTLLHATSIAYSASVSGTYLSTELFPRLGIAEQLKPKSRRIVSERVGAVVARGEAEIGLQQISELLPIKGIDYVGPLPDDAQRVSTFSAGIVVGAKQPEAARALVKFLESPAVIPVLRKAGLEPAREVPTFKVDASWPKIPNNWQFGQVSSVAIDAQDHVWILQRPGTLSAAEKPRAAPPVLEFNADGTFIQAWGGPRPQYEWPESEHGIHVDPKGFVWIGGNGSKDHQILKFTRNGTFVMQIGHAGKSTGNADTQNLNQPADAFVHAKTNELFVADGYGNRRVIVFDADTGRFKRMWGAFGNTPSDAPPNPANPDEGENGPAQFVQPVHAARVSSDGLVYVSDRGGKRVQVFTIDGRYLTQTFIGRECKAPACGNGSTAASTAFSSDPQQRFLYVGNRSQAKVMVLDRKTLDVLDSFGSWGSAAGEFGTLHHMMSDSKGNLYVTEVTPLKPENRRVQKFTFVGLR